MSDSASSLPSSFPGSIKLPVKNLPRYTLTLTTWLRRYFHSGWAFLVPYVAAYLLYWYLRWPVNPRSIDLRSPVFDLQPPCLLWVYWAFHAINLVLAVIALGSWLRERRRLEQASLAHCPSPPAPIWDEVAGLGPSLLPSPRTRSRLLSVSLRLAPWLLLALVFWIPGVYLEWPADPWEHLRRINEWMTCKVVDGFPAGYKSSYFLAYSLVGWTSQRSHQLIWLDFYYSGSCLLLCWQYYRLARAVGVGERASFIFVMVQVLTFGNNIFGFYRYYGISSSLYAQMGAIALIRITIDTLGVPAAQDNGHGEQQALRSGFAPKAIRSVFKAVLLLAFIAFNHIQGIGIAGLGVGAAIVWRLIGWRRSMIWWLAATAVLLSVAAVLWWPKNDALNGAYRASHWLTAWYGFNFFSLSSPAFNRALQIVGFFGVINIGAGLFLLRRNHIVGWLSTAPYGALCLPIVAIPFANALAPYMAGDSGIIMFHRVLLAIPCGLALVVVAEDAMISLRPRLRKMASADSFMNSAGVRETASGVSIPHAPCRLAPFYLVLIGVMAFAITPAGDPYFNRVWNVLSVPPQDLQMKSVVSAVQSAKESIGKLKSFRLVTTAAITNVLNAVFPRFFTSGERLIGHPVVRSLEDAVAVALTSQPTNNSQFPNLTRDPLMADPLAWKTLTGPSPDFIDTFSDFRGSWTAMQNPPGQRCDIFTCALISIDATQDYLLECSVRQPFSTSAIAYLAVAWYDQTGRPLISSSSGPEGAGYPAGWANGTYSYFGLVGDTVPTTWTIYRTSFGRHEAAAIPVRAKFVRVGALLNYSSTRAATVQITNIRLWQKARNEITAAGTFPDDERSFIVVPMSLMICTCASQAAQASHHWPPQEVAVDLAGGRELSTAARIARGVPLNASGAIFDVPPWGQSAAGQGSTDH